MLQTVKQPHLAILFTKQNKLKATLQRQKRIDHDREHQQNA
jgi:hypothetical protein